MIFRLIWPIPEKVLETAAAVKKSGSDASLSHPKGIIGLIIGGRAKMEVFLLTQDFPTECLMKLQPDI